jgi:DNA polymerase elongation subunit (family B)
MHVRARGHRMSLADRLATLAPAASNVKILTIDVERFPGRWKSWDNMPRFLSADKMIQAPRIFCFAAKWLHEKKPVTFDERDGHRAMIEEAWELLSEADVIVTYNGTRADVPWLNEHFLDYRLGPTAPFKHVDLIKTNRARFKLPYRSLDYLAGRVVDAHKEKTDGSLWDRCEEGDPAAYETMLSYNRKDVTLTEQLMLELLPWLTDMPHMGIMAASGETQLCYACARPITESQRWSKPARAYVREYALYRCSCQAWNRTSYTIGKPQHTRPVK